jgi:DNA-directed RNA polymerase subunit RPC12/RpoP
VLDGAATTPDPDRSLACPDCGWQGPETAMRGAGAGDPAGTDLACPRCGAPVQPDMPSVPEILAARRMPLPEEPAD